MGSTFYDNTTGYWVHRAQKGKSPIKLLKSAPPEDRRAIPTEVVALAAAGIQAAIPTPSITTTSPTTTPTLAIDMGQRVERFIKAKSRQDSVSTAAIRRCIADQFVTHCREAGIRWLHEVRPSVVKDFTEDQIERRHLQEQSIRNQLSLLSPLFSEAILHGEFIGLNPVRAIIKGLKSTADSTPTACITEEEWSSLMSEVARRKARTNLKGRTSKCPQWVEDALVVMRRTGLRVTAATSMEFSWADFDQQRINVPKPFRKFKGNREYAAYLAPEVRAILERRRAELGPEATKVFPEVRSSSHLYERVSYMVKALIKRGEWKRDPKRYNHALRVAFITESLDNGVPLVHVAKLSGHGSTRMTERYNRASSQDAIDAIAALARKSG